MATMMKRAEDLRCAMKSHTVCLDFLRSTAASRPGVMPNGLPTKSCVMFLRLNSYFHTNYSNRLSKNQISALPQLTVLRNLPSHRTWQQARASQRWPTHHVHSSWLSKAKSDTPRDPRFCVKPEPGFRFGRLCRRRPLPRGVARVSPVTARTKSKLMFGLVIGLAAAAYLKMQGT